MNSSQNEPAVGSIDKVGPYDALEKAKPGEPMFPLLGRDPAAPPAITEWARVRRNRAMKNYGESSNAANKELLAAELRQCANAEDIALQMGEWRTQHQIADGPARASYNDVIKSAEEQAEADRRQRRITACQHLREAAYHLCEGKDGLVGLELVGQVTQSDLQSMLARINGIADKYEARRPGFHPEPDLPLGAGA